jgi:hypothetical protein
MHMRLPCKESCYEALPLADQNADVQSCHECALCSDAVGGFPLQKEEHVCG